MAEKKWFEVTQKNNVNEINSIGEQNGDAKDDIIKINNIKL